MTPEFTETAPQKRARRFSTMAVTTPLLQELNNYGIDPIKFSTIMVQPQKFNVIPKERRKRNSALATLETHKTMSSQETSSFKHLFITQSSEKTQKTSTVDPMLVELPKSTRHERIRKFQVEVSPLKGLSHGLPFSKYSASILECKRLQTQVVSDEIRILIDKIQLLRKKFSDLAQVRTIFAHIELRSKSDFNSKLEESIGLIK